MDKLLAALFEAKKEIKPALKSAENPFYKSKYADLKEIDHAVKSALENNGLLLIQTTWVGEGNSPILATYLYHVESGQSISSEYPVTYSKPDPQSIGSGLTYARRYQLACICGVITEDDDAEAAMARKETKPDNKQMKAKIISEIQKLFKAEELDLYLESVPEEIKNETKFQEYISKVKGGLR
jgi:hypothetical protein